MKRLRSFPVNVKQSSKSASQISYSKYFPRKPLPWLLFISTATLLGFSSAFATDKFTCKIKNSSTDTELAYSDAMIFNNEYSQTIEPSVASGKLSPGESVTIGQTKLVHSPDSIIAGVAGAVTEKPDPAEIAQAANMGHKVSFLCSATLNGHFVYGVVYDPAIGQPYMTDHSTANNQSTVTFSDDSGRVVHTGQGTLTLTAK